MNYTKQLKGFYLRRQVKTISYHAVLLYYLLTEQFNFYGFPKAMPIPISRLAKESGMTRAQIIRARKELIDKGYMKIVPVPRSKKNSFDLSKLPPYYCSTGERSNTVTMIPFSFECTTKDGMDGAER